MKTAISKNKLIYLENIGREHYQKIYQSGKQGELLCPVCKASVRFYLGIMKEPHFYHIQKTNSSCIDPPREERINEVQDAIETNGFRLPRGRGIATVEVTESIGTYKKPQPLKVEKPFVSVPDPVSNHTSGYIGRLLSCGTRLDGNQLSAVTETSGSLLVLAGAGSGKTRVLTARTAYMLTTLGIDPKSIMLLTFTSKAAEEMKRRLLTYPDMKKEKVSRLVSGTFHSIFYRILIFHSPEQWSSDKLLKKEWERDKLLKEAGKELDLNEKEFPYDLALQQIGYWKNSLLLPADIKPEDDWEEKTAVLYKRYEELKSKAGRFDFDDMLLGCYELLNSNPELLKKYQQRFQYFLIDEFQDINKVQYELIKLFSSISGNVCAVGDDDQSIYAFRGSDPGYLLRFEKDFPGAKVIHLSENYRSSHQIVTSANKVISANKHRRLKKMNAQFPGNEPPFLFFPYDEEEEATAILTDLQERIADGALPSDFAILYRTHAGSRAIFERLANSSLPFKLDQDAESFYDRRTVKSILAFLRLSLNEDDQEALPYIIPPLFLKQASVKDLKAMSILQDCSFLEAFSHLKTGHTFQENKLRQAAIIIRSLKHLNPLEAINLIETKLGFQDYLKKRGNEGNKLDRSSDDLKDIKVAAKNFERIQEFVEHADHMSAMNREIKKMSRQTENGITLSTFHRAKGLEYDTVYILGAVDGSLPHDYALESFRNGDESPLEEERRLLYVAMTRARNHLLISIPDNRRGKKALRSRFLRMLR